MHVLSKSSYIRGRQCPKALWLSKHRRDLKAPVDEAKQAIFNTGTEVGLLARGLFPGGVDCSPLSPNDFGPAILATKAAIQRGERVIYEAAFSTMRSWLHWIFWSAMGTNGKHTR